MTKETPLGILLLLYVPITFSYSLLCGELGQTYSPLETYEIYAVGCFFAFLCSTLFYRPKRLWPPTPQESLAALASVIILTSATFSLLLPQSLIAVVASKSGALLLPSLPFFKQFPRLLLTNPQQALAFFKKHLALPSLAVLAVLLAAWHKPLRFMLVPLGLAVLYVFGYALKLRAVKLAKGSGNRQRVEFFMAEQLVVAVFTLVIAVLLHQYRLAFPSNSPPVTTTDYRFWLVAFTSYGAGLIGSQLVLHSTPQTVIFPAYRAASLVCALGAAVARGELKPTMYYWRDWVAIALALSVVLWASGAFRYAARRLRK